MMNKFAMNALYLALISSSFIFSFGAFKTWNADKEYILKANNRLDRFFVDQCIDEEKRIHVSGWAFIENNRQIMTQLYVKLENGKYKKLFTQMKMRPDVSTHFEAGDLYDKSGFEAAVRKDKSDSLTREILILAKNPNGDIFSANYTCQ